VLDTMLRVLAVVPIDDVATHADTVAALVAPHVPPPSGARAPSGVAPVLIVERIVEPDLCRRLIDAFETGTPEETGVMMNLPGVEPKLVVDPYLKRRRDVRLEGELRELVYDRIRRRLVPEIRKSFQFSPTRVERYVVACYYASDGGFFSAHRDNQGSATAHRQFACTINLNAEDYEGGDLSFPEFGPLRYRAPTGGSAVFSCSLMHQVDPITKGQRYCLIPFMNDDRGEVVRKKNQRR
jgi:hypothetical protein